MIDLWGDEEFEDKSEVASKKVEVVKDLFLEPDKDKDMRITISDKTIHIISHKSLSKETDYDSLLLAEENISNGEFYYTIPLRPSNAFILRYLLKNFKIQVSPTDVKTLASEADKLPKPKAFMSESGKSIEVSIPTIKTYKKILNTLNSYPLQNGHYRIPVNKLLDLETLVEITPTNLPKIAFSKEVKQLVEAPIEGFDGTLDSLKNISIDVLNVVQANNQSYKSMAKSSKKTLSEKIKAFGIETLYDLITWFPRRYIDKSSPQEIRDLVVDEQATILGIIEKVDTLPNNMGVKFTINTGGDKSIPVSFWRQHWLRQKFKVGMEVIVTGKFILWNKTPQLNGNSIENADEAAILPIVPVYKQSESKGITTTFLVSAVRELFSRLGDIKLPEYLETVNSIDYYEAYKELHLPSDLQHHKRVIDSLAFYELVYLQLLIQNDKKNNEDKLGLPQSKTSRNLQEKAVKSLPFTLTNGQQEYLKKMNLLMADDKPSSVLLNSDVGTGKTLCAQLSCLRSVEAGYQAVLLGPTDILARQLYNTFEKIIKNLNDQGEDIKICLINGGLKAAEKKLILKQIAEGEVDIIVGTHSVLSDSVKYKNLGFIAIDEQQKFGADQRSKLLNSRDDNRIPDLLMQSATPIPRSTAQVFYGDIDMIALKDKPAGRLPIITEWLPEDPNEFLTQVINPIWEDIREEAAKGNQTFVITPLVKESEKIDAASVERAFKELSNMVLKDLNVGFVHGQMKNDEQKQIMEDFRNKKYDVMIASTVVEVGVDIPDATRMIILSADRLGASSLHQIRGRVGRNSKQSKCYLVSLGLTDSSQARLQSLVENSDGFEVAKADLLTRGEGKMFGTEQSGTSEMLFANLTKHGEWVEKAKNKALNILSSPHREEALKDAYIQFNSNDRKI